MIFVATSSITHNFVLSDRKSIEGFINALDEAEKDKAIYSAPRPLQGKLLTNSNEIINLMTKRNDRKIFSR